MATEVEYRVFSDALDTLREDIVREALEQSREEVFLAYAMAHNKDDKDVMTFIEDMITERANKNADEQVSTVAAVLANCMLVRDAHAVDIIAERYPGFEISLYDAYWLSMFNEDVPGTVIDSLVLYFVEPLFKRVMPLSGDELVHAAYTATNFHDKRLLRFFDVDTCRRTLLALANHAGFFPIIPTFVKRFVLVAKLYYAPLLLSPNDRLRSWVEFLEDVLPAVLKGSEPDVGNALKGELIGLYSKLLIRSATARVNEDYLNEPNRGERVELAIRVRDLCRAVGADSGSDAAFADLYGIPELVGDDAMQIGNHYKSEPKKVTYGVLGKAVQDAASMFMVPGSMMSPRIARLRDRLGYYSGLADDKASNNLANDLLVTMLLDPVVSSFALDIIGERTVFTAAKKLAKDGHISDIRRGFAERWLSAAIQQHAAHVMAAEVAEPENALYIAAQVEPLVKLYKKSRAKPGKIVNELLRFPRYTAAMDADIGAPVNATQLDRIQLLSEIFSGLRAEPLLVANSFDKPGYEGMVGTKEDLVERFAAKAAELTSTFNKNRQAIAMLEEEAARADASGVPARQMRRARAYGIPISANALRYEARQLARKQIDIENDLDAIKAAIGTDDARQMANAAVSIPSLHADLEGIMNGLSDKSVRIPADSRVGPGFARRFLKSAYDTDTPVVFPPRDVMMDMLDEVRDASYSELAMLRATGAKPSAAGSTRLVPGGKTLGEAVKKAYATALDADARRLEEDIERLQAALDKVAAPHTPDSRAFAVTVDALRSTERGHDIVTRYLALPARAEDADIDDALRAQYDVGPVGAPFAKVGLRETALSLDSAARAAGIEYKAAKLAVAALDVASKINHGEVAGYLARSVVETPALAEAIMPGTAPEAVGDRLAAAIGAGDWRGAPTALLPALNPLPCEREGYHEALRMENEF